MGIMGKSTIARGGVQMKRVMFVRGLLAVMLLVPWALSGCGEKDQPQSKSETVSGDDVKKEVKEAYEATKAYTQEQMQAVREQMETRLDEYGKEIDQLQANVEKLGGDAKEKAEEQLAALRQKRDAVAEKVKELGSSSGNAWEQLKAGIDAAMEDLGNAYKKAADEFSKS
jgi:predicted RNase H-like nuclease (RuvC/YqgF family)